MVGPGRRRWSNCPGSSCFLWRFRGRHLVNVERGLVKEEEEEEEEEDDEEKEEE